MNIASLLPDSSLRRQIWRFALVGFANVGVDLALYASLMMLDAGIVISKGVAYLGCVLFAFVLNKYWTFENRDSGLGRVAPFALLYSASLGLNVAVNTVVASVAGRTTVGLTLAFIAAVGSSAMLNFIGMRFLFRGTKPHETAPGATMPRG